MTKLREREREGEEFPCQTVGKKLIYVLQVDMGLIAMVTVPHHPPSPPPPPPPPPLHTGFSSLSLLLSEN